MKRMKRVGALLLFVVLLFSMTSCFSSPKNSYDLAVENGFSGSVIEWLASLKGDGLDINEVYQAARQNGYDKDFLSFLEEYLSFDSGKLLESLEAPSINVQRALLASVSISCDFEYRVDSWGFASTKQATQLGSGVIYQLDKESGDAYVITNYHVVYYYAATTENKISDSISVFLYGMEYSAYAIPATYVGGSMEYDIAVLRIDQSEILKQSHAVAVTPADSNKIAVGSTAIVIGNAAGCGIAVNKGLVSVDSETVSMTAPDNVSRATYRLIRVDAAINEGNSGGGLFTADGRLIGIVNSKVVSTDVKDIGHAIPSNVAIDVAQNIIDHSDGKSDSSLNKFVLGIRVAPEASGAYFDPVTQTTRIRETVVVQRVERDSLAYGKVKAADVIVSVTINGVTYDVDREFVIIDAMLKVRAGDSIVLTVIREDSEMTFDFVATDANFTIVP